jgi:uncharacterized protein (TIGR03437 family)
MASALAPNTLATIYGVDLAFTLSNVQVTVGGIVAPQMYVSSGQINFVIPCSLIAGDYTLRVMRDGMYGPDVPITLQSVAPALFQQSVSGVVATRPDWSAITPQAPAKPGDIVILWATGLGPAVDAGRCSYDQPAAAADSIPLAAFQVLLNGVPVPGDSILYAGVAPGFEAFYQINLKLPAQVDANPEVRISLNGQTSPPNLLLPVAP